VRDAPVGILYYNESELGNTTRSRSHAICVLKRIWLWKYKNNFV